MTKAKLKTEKPKTESEWVAHRVKLTCKVGRDAAENGNLAFAVFNLLHAVEDLAVLITEINKSKPNE